MKKDLIAAAMDINSRQIFEEQIPIDNMTDRDLKKLLTTACRLLSKQDVIYRETAKVLAELHPLPQPLHMYPYKKIPKIPSKKSIKVDSSEYELLPVNPAWWQSDDVVNEWKLGRFVGIRFDIVPNMHFFIRKAPPNIYIVERASGAVVFFSKKDVNTTAESFIQMLHQFENPQQYIESIRNRSINKYFLRHFQKPDGSKLFLKTKDDDGNIVWVTLRDNEKISSNVYQKIIKVEFLLDGSAFYIANISGTSLYNRKLGALAVIEPLSGVILLTGDDAEQLQTAVRKYVDRMDWVRLRANLTHEIIQDGAAPFVPGITHYDPAVSILQSCQVRYPYLTYSSKTLTEFLLKNPNTTTQEAIFFFRTNQIFINNHQIEWMRFMWNIIKDTHREFVLRKELENEKNTQKETKLNRKPQNTENPKWFV